LRSPWVRASQRNGAGPSKNTLNSHVTPQAAHPYGGAVQSNVRFCATGTDIPDDLVNAVNDGSVTFICGAGVSKRVGLPLFKDLTEQVYSLSTAV